MKESFAVIGIDGGATKVSAWQVEFTDDGQSFTLTSHNAQKSYSEIPGFVKNFTPVPVTEQLSQQAEKKVALTEEERQQGAVYVEACARVVEELAEKLNQKKLLLGLGMPGLKTSDLRGIEVVANGPRIPDYAQTLEERLALVGISLVLPIHRIGSDADYCGIGENYSTDGLFRDVEDAYYLGGGTGVADALKLRGQLLPFDHIKPWMAKTWELKNQQGLSLERFASAGGIQALYASIAKKELQELNAQNIYPLQIAEMAVNGDSAARQTFEQIVENLSELLLERITTLYSGWKNPFEFVNPNKPPLEDTHEFKGTLLQRIILGQRLGELYQSPAGKQILQQPLLDLLREKIKNSPHLDERAKAHYTAIEHIVVASNLREAPALGAGIDAFLNWKNNRDRSNA